MSPVLVSPRVWRTVAHETARYWFRQHKLLLAFVLLLLVIAVGTALVGRGESTQQLLGLMIFFAPIVAGLLTMSGIVADELESGLIVIWFQKPGSIMRYYLTRYLLQQGLLAVFTLLLAVLLAALAAASVMLEPARALLLPRFMLFLACLSAAIVFAFSAWGVRRDSTAALLTIAGTTFLAVLATRFDGHVRDVLHAILFPMDALFALAGRTASATAHPTLIVVGQIVGWTAIGVLGLLYTQRSLHRSG